MIDLHFFYWAKMPVVFILMHSLATLEAQRNENDKFFNLMTAIGEDFGGVFNEAEKALELDLNGTNAFLERLHKFATREIVTKVKNGEFECKEPKNLNFKMTIKTILDEDMLNMLKVVRVYNITSVLSEKFKPNKKVKDLLKELSEKFSEEQLFNLLFSLAARLEALVHGKNIDGRLKEKKENSKDKIQTFLAVSKCFILPEWKSSIFDYWIKIIEMKTKSIFGVAIYKEKYDETRWHSSKKEAFELSRENYKILKQLNDQKFSIYESLNLLRAAFNGAYTGEQNHILRGKTPQIYFQIPSVIRFNYFNWATNNDCNNYIKCVFAMFFQNISENLMKMMSDKGIDPKLHLDSQEFKLQEYVQNNVEENCKKFSNEKAKILFLNNVDYELVINFEFNQRKDVLDRVEDLFSEWIGDRVVRLYGGLRLSEELYLKENAFAMLYKIKHFTMKTNRETISIIEALIEKEHFQQLNLVSLFDRIKTLMEVSIPEEEDKFWEAKKEINTKELENDIEFLKNNHKSIAEEKYQKAVAIICTIKQHGEKVKELKSKIKTIEIKKQLDELSSTIHNNEMQYVGPELWEQTEDSCNQLKPKQIEMEEKELVSEEILLKDIQFEFNEIWKSNEMPWKKCISIEGAWRGIEEYYLSIPLMHLTEQARILAKTFGKMLQNAKEHFCQKKEASNCEDMIIPEWFYFGDLSY